MRYKFTHVTCKNAGKDIVFRRSQRCILPVAGAFCFEDLEFQTRLWSAMAAGLWTVLQAEVYIELSCGIRCREGVKEYEEKMCDNAVNHNNDRIFSWLWKQQRRKR